MVKFSISVNVHMPKDRITQLHQGYGFVEFLGEEDADYAIKVMNMIKVYGKPIRVNKVQMLSSLYIITLYLCHVHTNTVITKYCNCKGYVMQCIWPHFVLVYLRKNEH